MKDPAFLNLDKNRKMFAQGLAMAWHGGIAAVTKGEFISPGVREFEGEALIFKSDN